jgi:uncharacterized membrane protein YbhN (UPF0104 family)
MSEVNATSPELNNREKTKKRVKFSASLVLGVSILIFILDNLGITPTIAMDTLLNVGYFYALLVLCAYAVLISLISHKWKVIVLSLAPAISPRKWHFMYYGSFSFFVNGVIPQSGFGVRVLSLKMLYNVPTVKGVLIQFIDQLSELMVTAIFIAPGILYILHLFSLLESAMLLLASIATLFLIIKFLNVSRMGSVVVWLNKRSSGLMRFSIFVKFKSQFVDIPFEKLNVSWIVTIALIKMVTTVSATYIAMTAAGISLPPVEVMIIAPVVYLIGLFSITPAGLGTVDAGWFGVLYMLGVDKIAIGKFLIIDLAIGNLALFIVTFISYLVYTVLNRPRLA